MGSGDNVLQCVRWHCWRSGWQGSSAAEEDGETEHTETVSYSEVRPSSAVLAAPDT